MDKQTTIAIAMVAAILALVAIGAYGPAIMDLLSTTISELEKPGMLVQYSAGALIAILAIMWWRTVCRK